MMTRSPRRSSLLITLLLAAPALAPAQSGKDTAQGIFQGSKDIGNAQPGASTYDPATKTYTLNGGGLDVWGGSDDFRYTWTKMSGDITFTADMRVAQPPTFPKSKGMLMIRESLDPGSPYVDIAEHGDGHIDLQWRATPGGETKDVDLPEHSAVRLRIERRGDRFTAYALTGGMETPNAPSISIPMQTSVYVGLGACSHDVHALQTVTFSNIIIDHGEQKVTAAQLR